MTTPQAIGKLYDRLLGAETNKVADQNFTIHKRLHFPASEQARGIHDSNDWLRVNIDLPDDAHILDAGCGVGGSLFALLADGRSGVGITLSQKQCAVAQNEAQRLGLTTRCQFRQQSYDDPLPGTFDLILSIEALIHSSHLAISIQNLSRHLRPDGRLVIIEDMARQDLSTNPVAKIWQQSWYVQTAYTATAYQQAITAAGLQLVQTADFTPYLQAKPWPSWLVQTAWHLTQTLSTTWRGSTDIFVGGWALERLYRRKLMQYQAIVAKRVST